MWSRAYVSGIKKDGFSQNQNLDGISLTQDIAILNARKPRP